MQTPIPGPSAKKRTGERGSSGSPIDVPGQARLESPPETRSDGTFGGLASPAAPDAWTPANRLDAR